MGILDTVKDAVTLIQKVDNIDLYKQMMALQTQAVALVEENRTLKEQLATRAKLEFRDIYWSGEDGPYCSSCWDVNSRLVRVHKKPGFHPVCPACKTMVQDESGGPVIFSV